MNRFILILLLIFFPPIAAHAQCVSPPAEMGVIIFNKAHKVMQYCNGEAWVGLWGGNGAGDAQRISGEVAAFDLDACPEGWTALTSAQGRFVVGTGGGYNRGDTGGANSVSLSVAQLPAHNHTGTAASAGAHTHTGTAASAGAHTHTVAHSNNSSGGSSPGYNRGPNATTNTSSAGAHTHTLNINSAGAHTHSLTINNTGSDEAHENRPPYLALLYCRKD